MPVEELKLLRKNERNVETGETLRPLRGICEIEIDQIETGSCRICFNQDLVLDCRDGVFTMEFLNRTGAGRTVRRAEIDRLEDLRIIMDTSAVEVYVNHGSTVFTSRYYPEPGKSRVVIDCENSRNRLWDFGSLIKAHTSFLLPPIWYNETICRRRRSQSTGGVERRDENHGKIYNCISQRLRKYVSDCRLLLPSASGERAGGGALQNRGCLLWSRGKGGVMSLSIFRMQLTRCRS